MRVYAIYQGRFAEGWIPDDYFKLNVLPALFRNRRPLQHRRTLSRRLFGPEVVPDLAYRINGLWFTADYRALAPDALLDHVFAGYGEVYLKAESSSRGRGVKRVGRSDFWSVAGTFDDDAVVQRPVVQHSWFNEVNPDAVATVRITTSYLDGPGPRFRAAYLRLGYGGRRYIEAEQSLRWAITDPAGALASEALDEQWRPLAKHPDTGYDFRNSRIPFFEAAVRTCVELHARIPHDQILGWDIGIEESGAPSVMEWNSGHTDIKFTEAAVGPVFADCGLRALPRPAAAGGLDRGHGSSRPCAGGLSASDSPPQAGKPPRGASVSGSLPRAGANRAGSTASRCARETEARACRFPSLHARPAPKRLVRRQAPPAPMTIPNRGLT